MPEFRGAARRWRGNESRAALVVYRVNPVAYKPEKLCNRNPHNKAPRWISWSVLCLDRRYYTSSLISYLFWYFLFCLSD
jgi:hypothetical protein